MALMGSGVVAVAPASCFWPCTDDIYGHHKMSSSYPRTRICGRRRLLPRYSNGSKAGASSLNCRQPIVSAEPPPPPGQSSVLLPPDSDIDSDSNSNSSRRQPHLSTTTTTTTKQEAAAAAGGVVMSPGLIDYFQVSEDLVLRSEADGGPPRWFCLLDCHCSSSHSASSSKNHNPLLLYLPGVDGVGSGLLLQCKKLGESFLLSLKSQHLRVYHNLVKLVEETVRSENSRRPHTPVYLVGESFGGCLALAIASRNPDIDLVLVLANPATCFSKSQLLPLLPFSHLMPKEMNPSLLYMLCLSSGIPSRMAMGALQKSLPLEQTVGELSQAARAVSSYISVLADLLGVETLNWKLKMLKSAEAFSNSRLHAIKARTLILSSGRDSMLPSEEEGERLRRLLPDCQIRTFSDRGHVPFLEDGFDLVTIIKCASFYQRGRCVDYVLDYLPPKPPEFEQIYEPHRWTEVACNPVMLSTLENGKIVQGLKGIPCQGPVLYVGYHMMLGFELIPLVARFWMERNIVLRGIAHPMAFKRLKDGKLPDLSTYDAFRFMGAVPASATTFYKLFSTKSHVLLYPGGMREALHRKGEEHKLIWPEQSEFVRMAARFGAKIIPFGAVGEDDFGQLLFDYDDLMKIPYFEAFTRELTDEAVNLRSEREGEIANQDIHLPVILPKVPGRLYFLFGKPIETEGRKQDLKRRDEAQQVYIQVKSEVESCIAYLKEKRENDPYRNVLARLTYQAVNGFDAEVPTFEL
ncbi:phytyl ester synthase 2, chloroplastic isoform X2 [Coffea arabica]|uniref:Phytyl ester synthase 2, chloroplastic isoform X2 n=1 Tax=Coffea arabica TaxID=13443 RepID=A0ABM4V6J4_COFAR